MRAVNKIFVAVSLALFFATVVKDINPLTFDGSARLQSVQPSVQYKREVASFSSLQFGRRSNETSNDETKPDHLTDEKKNDLKDGSKSSDRQSLTQSYTITRAAFWGPLIWMRLLSGCSGRIYWWTSISAFHIVAALIMFLGDFKKDEVFFAFLLYGFHWFVCLLSRYDITLDGLNADQRRLYNGRVGTRDERRWMMGYVLEQYRWGSTAQMKSDQEAAKKAGRRTDRRSVPEEEPAIPLVIVHGPEDGSGEVVFDRQQEEAALPQPRP